MREHQLFISCFLISKKKILYKYLFSCLLLFYVRNEGSSSQSQPSPSKVYTQSLLLPACLTTVIFPASVCTNPVTSLLTVAMNSLSMQAQQMPTLWLSSPLSLNKACSKPEPRCTWPWLLLPEPNAMNFELVSLQHTKIMVWHSSSSVLSQVIQLELLKNTMAS